MRTLVWVLLVVQVTGECVNVCMGVVVYAC